MKGLSIGKKTDDASAKPRAGGTPLWLYFVPSVVVALLFLLALGVVTLQLLGKAKEEVNQTASEVVASSLSERIVGLLQARVGELRLLSGYEYVQQALTSDNGDIAAAEARLGSAVPDLIRARLYTPAALEQLKPDPSGKAPIGYAGIDMIKRAAKGVLPPAEIHQISSGSPYVAMALPVSQGRAQGVLFAAWELKPIKRLVAAVPSFNGELQLVQGGRGGYVVAGSNGSEDLRNVLGTKDVDGSVWSVLYNASAAETGSESSLLAAVIGGGVLALLLSIWLQMRMFGRDLRQDMTTLVNLGEGIATGSGGTDPKVRVGVSRDAILLLADYARNSLKQRRQPAKPDKKPAGKPAPRNEPDSLLVPSMAGEGIEVESVLQDEFDAPAQAEPKPKPKPKPDPKVAPKQAVATAPKPVEIPASIFRAYDVRGVVGKTLNVDIAKMLARAFAELAMRQGANRVCVAHDARLSSPELYQAFCEGLQEQGAQVIQLGLAPVALPYLHMHTTEHTATVMVTGSHNPAEYNGFKLYVNGQALQGEALQELHQRASSGAFAPAAKGRAVPMNMRGQYLQAVSEQTQVARPLKIVVDGGNGAAGELACELLKAVGCEPIPLFCEPDGNFPNHHPDPSQQENLSALQLEVQAQSADLGIAFDGDGDRLGVVDNAGNYVWPEHLLMLLSADILQRHPGTDVVFDVKSSRNLAAYVLANGGRPIMASSGHTRMKEKMRETGALLGGEFSGHFFIKERWFGHDDAVYVAARLLEVLALDPRPLDQLVAELPSSPRTPEFHMPVEEGQSQALMQKIIANADFGDARLVTLDGVRAEFTQGWGLVRASNTTPALTFRFEAESEAALQQVQQTFRDLINRVLPGAQLPF